MSCKDCLYITTGVTRGLGRSIYELLGKRGALQVGVSRSIPRDSNNIALSIPHVGFIIWDFSHTPSSSVQSQIEKQLFNFISSTKCKTVVLISNAGSIRPISQSTLMPIEELATSLNINCLAPAFLAATLAAITKAMNMQLLIVSVTSGAALRPIDGWQAYCTSKAAIKMALGVLSLENSHVRVVDFDPGVLDTDMQRDIRRSGTTSMSNTKEFLALKESGKLRHPGDVSEMIIEKIKRILG